MKLLMRFLMVCALLSFVSVPLSAGDVQDLSRHGPCRSDIQKFCKNVRPGNGRILRCMKQYGPHLSDNCKNHISAVKEKTGKFAKVCKKDVGKFCSGIRAGKGRIYNCLKEHRTELSVRCADYVR